MALEDDIKQLLVVGNSVAVTIHHGHGDYSGVVERVTDLEFELRGELMNPAEHFSNLSADPIFRMHTLEIADIASISKA